jgi:hypothetical protein
VARIDGAGDADVLLVVEFPPRVCVDAELFDTTWPVVGAPSSCEVVLPSAGPDYDVGVLGRPRLDRFGTIPAEFWPDRWGRMSTGNAVTRQATEAYIEAAVAVTTCRGDLIGEPERDFNDATIAALTRWVDSVAEWLEVIAKLDVQAEELGGISTSHHVRQPSLVVGEQGSRWLTERTLPTIVSHRSHAASREDWQLAVTLTNTGIEPADEHRFLRDSRAALRRGHLRRAVIDAGTSTEIALSEAIRRRLRGLSVAEEPVAQALRNANGVVELYDLLAAIGATLPGSRDRLMDQLAGTRNRAAHAGRVPTLEEARRSLVVADEIVATLSPVPSAGDEETGTRSSSARSDPSSSGT